MSKEQEIEERRKYYLKWLDHWEKELQYSLSSDNTKLLQKIETIKEKLSQLDEGSIPPKRIEKNTETEKSYTIKGFDNDYIKSMLIIKKKQLTEKDKEFLETILIKYKTILNIQRGTIKKKYLKLISEYKKIRWK